MPTFSGLRDALRNMIVSAWHNYVNYGSDIGGYRSDGPEPHGRTQELFTRWFQMGAFVPLMENGGDNEHRPWAFDAPGSNTTLDTYRRFVNIHYELIPYLLTTGSDALENGHSVLLPQEMKHSPIIINLDFRLGEDVFVAPITENVTARAIHFPHNKNGEGWVDWWQPTQVYKSGEHVHEYQAPLDILPVFHREGSVLPLEVSTSDTNHGHESFADALTFLVAHPLASGGKAHVRDSAAGVQMHYDYDAAAKRMRVQVSAYNRPVVLSVRLPTMQKLASVHVFDSESARGERMAASVVRVSTLAELAGHTAVTEVEQGTAVFLRMQHTSHGVIAELNWE